MLDRVIWKSKPLPLQIKDEAARRPKCAIILSLIWEGGVALFFCLCVIVLPLIWGEIWMFRLFCPCSHQLWCKNQFCGVTILIYSNVAVIIRHWMLAFKWGTPPLYPRDFALSLRDVTRNWNPINLLMIWPGMNRTGRTKIFNGLKSVTSFNPRAGGGGHRKCPY